jgi:hypothetical protein
MNDDLLPDLIAAVEQQLSSLQTPYVAITLARLTALGLSRTQKSGHSGAKLSYGGGVRERDRRSLVKVQGWSGW